jgi:uncharacterized membrane protein
VSARAEFLATLRAGLRGTPAASIEEILADYTAHFVEGAAANRSEAEITAALGDPLALADELRMELRIKTFESAPSTRSGAHVVGGVIAMGAVNTVLLCIVAPLLALSGLTLTLASLAAAVSGVWFLTAAASLGLPGGTGTTVLCGLGLISAAISLGAFLALAARAVVNAIARYVRLQYRFLPRSPNPGTPT